jgi:membrane fusion protein (multidrug efflux system)
MAIVPLGQVWVDANFKEVQLRDMRIGQPVKLHADLYGSKVEFDGRIAGLGAGTGAAFAVLPPQNASGNWIKVVQRVPVRIELDAAQLARYPLRVGLSMEATVDVSRVEGAALTEVAARTPPVRMQTTEVFDASMQEADSRIRRILAQNMGRDPLPGDRSADGPSARRARP